MRGGVLLALGLGLLGPVTASVAAPPIEAFGQLPAVSNVDINPAGTRLAWIDQSGKTPRVVIYDIVRRGEVRSVNIPKEVVARDVVWAEDKTVLVSVTVTHSKSGARRDRREWQRWYSIDLFEDSPRMLLTRMGMLERNIDADLIHRRTARPGKIFMSGWDYRIGQQYYTNDLYEVDLKSGDGRMIEHGSGFTVEWAVDPSGKITVRSEFDSTRDRFAIQVREGSTWRTLYKSRGCGKLRWTYLTPDLASVLALGSTCDDARVKLWSVPLDGSEVRALVEDPVLDVEQLIVDSTGQSILGVRLAGRAGPVRWLNPRDEQRHDALRKSFDAEWITVAGQSKNGQRVVVRVEGPSRAPVFHLVDYDKKRADVIHDAYPGLAATTFGPVIGLEYQSRDNYPLFARLTLPPGSDGKNLPLVILPHDGPESRDADVFDWEAHFLASRGYAVLQPQFRGSTGLGRAHADAGRRQWGLRMQDDVTDAVRATIARGIVDPKRICIAGHGYGGYVALAGVAFTPDLYACAASIAGISDLPFMLGHIKRQSWYDDSPYESYWREHIGSVSDGHVAVYSPARSAANIRAPVLLIHGDDDVEVPMSQSEIMARAMKKAGKEYEFIELPGEDHWLSQSVTRIRMLTELEKFLAKNLGTSGTIN